MERLVMGPLDILERIFAMLCYARGNDDAVVELSSYVVYEQDVKELLGAKFEIVTPGFITPDRAKFSVIIHQDAERHLYLAILALNEDGWWLAALMKRCPACNGSQREDQWNPCRYCCASGWGNEEIWRERFFRFWN